MLLASVYSTLIIIRGTKAFIGNLISSKILNPRLFIELNVISSIGLIISVRCDCLIWIGIIHLCLLSQDESICIAKRGHSPRFIWLHFILFLQDIFIIIIIFGKID